MSSTGPTFTESDVAAFVATHSMPYQVPGTPHPVIARVEFLSAKDASVQFGGENFGVTDGTVLCVVHLTGAFQGNSPVGVSATTSTAVLVFDARTGNLIAAQV
jgi:hypothetical protein